MAFVKLKRIIPIALIGSAVIFAAKLGNALSENIYFLIGLGLVLFFVVSWVCKGDKLGLEKIKELPDKSVWIFAAVLALSFTIYVSMVCISRYSAFMAHNFDFGIFAQMFENMRTTGLPDTTLERNKLMSHFGVHFSPFYYVLLPFYMLNPRPEMILFLQAAFVAAGVFAVVKICKKLDLPNYAAIGFSIVYIFFPSLANGCIYDFHENKFLTMLILWLMYAVVSKNNILLAIFAALTLMVKEDAAIYVLAIALYILLTRKEFIKGSILFVSAGLYFWFATSMVETIGDGIMENRLINYMETSESGLMGVFLTCFTNFGYFISQVFTAEKLPFVIWMLLPVAFAPFFSKKKSIMLLLIPMLVVDLMSNWQYQYDINFQYTFGVAGLIIFMAIMVYSELKPEMRQRMLVFSVSMCIVMSSALFIARSKYYLEIGESTKDSAAAYEQLIKKIPSDEPITVDSSFAAHMYYFTEIYMYPNYHGEQAVTKRLLVTKGSVADTENKLADFIEQNNYEQVDEAGHMVLYEIAN